MKLSRLWETPVWEMYNPEGASTNTLLLDAMAIPRDNLGTAFDFMDVEHEGVVRIKSYVGNAVDAAVRAYDPQFSFGRIARSWVVTQQQGEWHSPHEHSSDLLIGVYYIQAKPGASSLFLLNPAPTSVFSSGLERVGGNTWDCRAYFEVKPEAGKLVLFPGIMKHFVMPNLSGEPRIALAMNIKLNRNREL